MSTMRLALGGLLILAAVCGVMPVAGTAAAAESEIKVKERTLVPMDEATYKQWLRLWEDYIVAGARNRYCDKSIGEDLAWFMTPFMDGFYYGFKTTGDSKYIDMLIDWTDSWVKRAVKQPDGHIGWPKKGGASTQVDNLNIYTADSLLGEAMVLRPVVLMAGEILKDAKLKEKYGEKAESYVKLAERIFEKWASRGAWRDTEGGGAIFLVLPYGIDEETGKWTEGYQTRHNETLGFSHPNNKANHTARWLLALSNVTGKPQYRKLAEKWFTLMKSRMKENEGGTYAIWHYWQPAGKWDYKADGSPKHWVGRHPNAGYYSIDVGAIVEAHENGLVFTAADIDRLVATAVAEKTYWSSLAPYSKEIQEHLEKNHKPDSWGGLAGTPAYLMLQKPLQQK
jgi:hypothetical protein